MGGGMAGAVAIRSSYQVNGSSPCPSLMRACYWGEGTELAHQA